MIQQVIGGLIKAADIIGSTMGPHGRRVLISRTENGGRWVDHFTRDGVTVAKYIPSIFPEGPEATGARLLVDVAKKVVQKVGDGTTTVCVMEAAMLKFINDHKLEGSLYQSYFKSVREASNVAIDFLKKESAEITLTKDILNQLAFTSANNRSDVSDMIADLVWKLGRDSYVKAKVSPNTSSSTDIQYGYQFDGGAFIPNFLMGRSSIALDRPYIVCIDEKVSDYKKLVPIYKAYQKVSANDPGELVIIATDIEGEALRFILANSSNEQKPVPVFVVRAPEPQDTVKRLNCLKDIQKTSGAGIIFSHYEGARIDQFERYNEKAFGRCESLFFTASESRIIYDSSQESAIKDYATSLELLIDASKGEDDEENGFLKARLAKLRTGVGIIYIGGSTEAEHAYLVDVIEDCVRATQSAMKSGVIIGGGYTLARAAEYINNVFGGENIITAALMAVQKTIHENANMSGYIASSPEMILDLDKGEEVHVSQCEIYDPLDVSVVALDAAVSLACEILDTKNTIHL